MTFVYSVQVIAPTPLPPRKPEPPRPPGNGEKCPRCRRLGPHRNFEYDGSWHCVFPKDVLEIRIAHEGYGCDTGCCGDVLYVISRGGVEKRIFEFGHHDSREEVIFTMERVRREIGAPWATLDADEWYEC